MRRRRPTDAELIWAAFLTVPEKDRLARSYEAMSEHARGVWLAIAKMNIAGGWLPEWNGNELRFLEDNRQSF